MEWYLHHIRLNSDPSSGLVRSIWWYVSICARSASWRWWMSTAVVWALTSLSLTSCWLEGPRLYLYVTWQQHQLQCSAQPCCCSSLDQSEMDIRWCSSDWYLSFTLSVVSQANPNSVHTSWPIATQALALKWWHTSDHGALQHQWSSQLVELMIMSLTYCYSIYSISRTFTMSTIFDDQCFSPPSSDYVCTYFVTPCCFCPLFNIHTWREM